MIHGDEQHCSDWTIIMCASSSAVNARLGTLINNFPNDQTRNLARVALTAMWSDEPGLATQLHHIVLLLCTSFWSAGQGFGYGAPSGSVRAMVIICKSCRDLWPCHLYKEFGTAPNSAVNALATGQEVLDEGQRIVNGRLLGSTDNPDGFRVAAFNVCHGLLNPHNLWQRASPLRQSCCIQRGW